jgi:AraC-like DNA-binding protein
MIDIASQGSLSLLQSLHLMGILPALFLVFFLTIIGCRGNHQAWIPAIYFLVLACSFVLPIASVYVAPGQNLLLLGGLLIGENMLIAASFLLIMQFLNGGVPSPAYWLIFAIPLVGGSGLIYAGLVNNQMCAADEFCRISETYRSLYNIFSASLVLLLLVYYSAQKRGLHAGDAERRHKYWLIISLIMMNLCMLAVDLARLANRLSVNEASIIIVIFKLTFIYLVITSLFRVFYPRMAEDIVHLPSSARHDPTSDQPIVDAIGRLLNEERIYREMRLNRAAFADKVGVSEHQLSRIVNHYFGKSVIELINHHRIEDAKRRLRDEPDTQVTMIGFEVGFNSIASFNRVFKDKVGVSPTQWREGKVS